MNTDLDIFNLIEVERQRQQTTITLIPSENYASLAVREAVGSVLSNKYSEGYAGARYYEGNEVIDKIELLAIARAKKIFGVPHANVQAYSGSPANSEILFALAEPGSNIMGLRLSSGGHLTHGHPKVTFSGKYYNSIQFGLDARFRIDYEQMRKLALEHKPKVIFLGTTAYPFIINWKLAREIADECGTYLVADISHEVGLVISKVLPSPVEFAHVVISTTHKSLRGPRGAIILVTDEGLKKDPLLPKKIDSAVMPGMQGGPHNNTTAGIAVALMESQTPEFSEHGKQVIANAQALAAELLRHDLQLVGDGTENHLMILDFSPPLVPPRTGGRQEGAEGKGTLVAAALNAAGIITNRNTVPTDTNPFYPSGLRLGTPAVTTRGMKEREMQQIASWIVEVVGAVGDEKLPEDKSSRQEFLKDFRLRMEEKHELQTIKSQVKELCEKFPVL